MTVFDVGQLENYQSLLDDIVTSLMLVVVAKYYGIISHRGYIYKVFIAVETLLIFI